MDRRRRGLDQMKNAFFITASIANVPAGAVRIDLPTGWVQEAEAWSDEEAFPAEEDFGALEHERWELDVQSECEGCLSEEELDEAMLREDLEPEPD